MITMAKPLSQTIPCDVNSSIIAVLEIKLNYFYSSEPYSAVTMSESLAQEWGIKLIHAEICRLKRKVAAKSFF